jgi:hypothetical protein
MSAFRRHVLRIDDYLFSFFQPRQNLRGFVVAEADDHFALAQLPQLEQKSNDFSLLL